MAMSLDVRLVVAVLVVCQVMPFSQAQCNVTTCRLPECACASVDIPNGMKPEEVPQMVVLMFHGKVSKKLEELIRNRIFNKKLTNPNECPIVGTFYVNNEMTDYCSVNRLWAEGHEIGVNGITAHTENFWQNATANQWDEEVARQVENLEEKAGISHFALEGWVTPHFTTGADYQFYTLNSKPYQFVYDATLKIFDEPFKDNFTGSHWPFTLDYSYRHTFPECTYKCPEKSHKGLWELPVLPLRDDKKPCIFINACPSIRDDPKQMYHLLHKNFDFHYRTNRSPFTVNINPRWLLNNKEAITGLENFIADKVKDDAVWFVTGSQAIHWARKPKSIGELDTFNAWGCFAKRYKRGCQPTSSNNRTGELFAGLFGHDGHYKLLLSQYISLIIIFLLLCVYDRNRK